MSTRLNSLLHANIDLRASPLSLETTALQVSFGRAGLRYHRDGLSVRWWTNWGLLYRLLRANFDGAPSKAFPDPPEARESDGLARYLTGRRVTALQYDAGAVMVRFVDRDGREEVLTADLVVGADGARSTVKQLLKAPTSTQGQDGVRYSGYIAWRGAVARSAVSKETADYFPHHASFNVMGDKMYILWCVLYNLQNPFMATAFVQANKTSHSYVIPPDHGSFDPDDLMLNWLIYQNLDEGSPTEASIFTDKDGRRHQTTVPQGLLDPTVWAHHRDALTARMAPPFAEIVSKAPAPFVTKVRDDDSEQRQASFHDGHVVLVGDALATYRPNVGRATDMAAAQVLGLAEVWRGEKELAEWERDVCREARTVWLQSRMVSEFGRGTWWSFWRAVAASIWWGLRNKFGWVGR